MIKRPVLWLGLAYITGELLAWLLWGSLAVFLFFSVIAIGIPAGAAAIYMMMPAGSVRKKRSRYYAVFFVLPAFFAFGYGNFSKAVMDAQRLDQTMVQVTDMHSELCITGEIFKVEEKERQWFLYVNTQGDFLPDKVLLTVGKDMLTVDKDKREDWIAGMIVKVRGSYSVFEHAHNEGGFDAWLYYQSRHIRGKMDVSEIVILNASQNRAALFFQKLKQHIEDNCFACLDEQSAGIAVGMLCGEKLYVKEDIKQLYQMAGISHILAISGLHISFAGMGLFRLLRRCRLPFQVCALSGCIIVILYGFFTGMAPSAQRAVFLCVLSLLGKLLGRTYDFKTGLAVAALCILIPSPLLITQPSFLLSFAAASSLALCPVGSRKACIYVTLGMMPVMAWCFYEIPAYSIFINLIVIPLMSLLYPAMAVCGIFGGVIGWIGMPVRLLIQEILLLYEFLCHICMRLPYSLVIIGKPKAWEMAVVYVLFLTAVLVKGNKLVLLKGLCMFLGCCLLFAQRKPDELTLTMVDVGQGDCFLLQTPEGLNLLFDGGSTDEKAVGEYTIIPFLKARGVRRIDGIFLSHMDEDHISGIRQLLEQIKNGMQISIGGLYFPESMKVLGGYEPLADLCRQLQVEYAFLHGGQTLDYGELNLDILWPLKEEVPDDSNDSCMVVCACYGQRRILFTGDLGMEAEMSLIEILKKMHIDSVDVLKVAHHGSSKSTSEAFLDAVRPKLALISCGKNNRYGHPHKETLQRLSDAGVRVCISFKEQEVVVYLSKEKVMIK